MNRAVFQPRTVWMCVFLFLLLPSMSFAGGSTCANATAVIPDGRSLVLDYVSPASTAWYQFNATANRSYSVELRDDLDPDSTDFTVSFYSAPVSCSAPASSTNYTDTHLTEPSVGPHGKRFSFVPATTGAYYISVLNGNSALGHYVTVTVAETTMYGDSWNTLVPLTSQWLLQNTTSQAISYTLTATAEYGGSTVYTASGTLGPASSTTSFASVGTGSFTPNIPVGQLGNAILTYNGPPGAVKALEFWCNYGTTQGPLGMMPIPFGPRQAK